MFSAQRPRRRQRLNFTRISIRERLHGRDRLRVDDGLDDPYALVLSQNDVDFIITVTKSKIDAAKQTRINNLQRMSLYVWPFEVSAPRKPDSIAPCHPQRQCRHLGHYAGR